MRRQLFAATIACFGSSVFGQAIDTPANQTQGALNNVQNTLQNGTQGVQDTFDRNVQQSPGTTVLENGTNRPSLNTQGQVNGTPGLNGNPGVQSNNNLQNNSNRQPGQLDSNLSTQVQGQPGVGTQQRGNNVPQDTSNQQRNTFQANGSNGSQSFQGQGQPMQPGQVQTGQSPYAGPVYMLRFDASGREFICVNGRAIYFDNVNSISAQGNSRNQNQSQNQYRAGYGSYDGNNGDTLRGRSPTSDQPKIQPSLGFGQNPLGGNSNSRTVDPTNSQKAKNDSNVTPPAPGPSDFDKQNDPKVRQNDAQSEPISDAKSEGINAKDSLIVPAQPKS